MSSRYVIYARVSTPHQAIQEKASIPEQVETARKAIEQRGGNLVDTYIDPGYQSWRRDRPEFQRMIRDGKVGKFDIIVAWAPDRLVGNAATCGDLEELLDKGIDLVGVVEPIDKSFILFHAVFKKMETQYKRERNRMGGIGRAKKGLPQAGRVPYGLKWNKLEQRLEYEETEALWYRRMFEWCIAGWGDPKIAGYLNHMGVPTKLGSSRGWSAPMVQKLLTRPTAYGQGYYRARDIDPIAIEYPPIVDKATFELAQKARAKRRNFRHRQNNRSYLLKHRRPVCGECGLDFIIKSRSETITSRGKTYKRKTNDPWLICRGMMKYPHIYNCRTPKHIPYDLVEKLVVLNVLKVLTDETYLTGILSTSHQDDDSLADRLAEAREALAQTKQKMAWLTTQARDGVIPDSIYKPQMAAMSEIAEYQQENVDNLERQTRKRKASDKRIEQALLAVRALRAQYDMCKLADWVSEEGWSSPEMNKLKAPLAGLIGELVDKITITHRNKVLIDFNLPLIEQARSRQQQLSLP